MTNVFSVQSKDVYLDIVGDDDDTIVMSIVEEDGRSALVRVDPADLARELITASPGFALSIGDIVRDTFLVAFAQDAGLDDREDDAEVLVPTLEGLSIIESA
jgi:hypothetical protein